MSVTDLGQQKIEWGIQAKALLDSQAFARSLDRIAAIYTEASINGVDTEHREDARKFVVLIDKLKQDLQSIATTGELTQKRNRDLTGERSKWSIL